MKKEEFLKNIITIFTCIIGLIFCITYYPSVLSRDNSTLFIIMLLLHILLSLPCFGLALVFYILMSKYIKGNFYVESTNCILKVCTIIMGIDTVLFIVMSISGFVYGLITNYYGHGGIALFGCIVTAILYFLNEHIKCVMKDKKDLEGLV